MGGGGKRDFHLPRNGVARLTFIEQPIAAFDPFRTQLAVRRLVVRIGGVEFLQLLLDHPLEALQIRFDGCDQLEHRLGIEQLGALFVHSTDAF